MRSPIKKLLNTAFVSSLFVLAGCLEEKASNTSESAQEPVDHGRVDQEQVVEEQVVEEQENPSKTLLGPLEVYFTLQTTPSSTAGTGSTPMKASAIHFFDTYVVVEEPDSGGRVFPSDQIIDFSWSGGGRLEPTGETEGGE